MEILPSIKTALSNLKGSGKRAFLGQLSLDLGWGGQSLVSKTLGVSRKTIAKGVLEIETGELIEDKFSERGRKPLEELNPDLIESIRTIIDGSSQIDPKFTSERLYTRLSAQQVRVQLLKRGYKESDLPTNQTIWNKMGLLGYQRRKVAKTKPKKNKTDRRYI